MKQRYFDIEFHHFMYFSYHSNKEHIFWDFHACLHFIKKYLEIILRFISERKCFIFFMEVWSMCFSSFIYFFSLLFSSSLQIFLSHLYLINICAAKIFLHFALSKIFLSSHHRPGKSTQCEVIPTMSRAYSSIRSMNWLSQTVRIVR